MPVRVTAAGRNLEASGVPIVITEVRYGKSTATDGPGTVYSTEAMIDAATDISTPDSAGRRIIQMNPIGRFAENVAQWQLSLPVQSDDYTISEAGNFTTDGIMYSYAYEDFTGTPIITISGDASPLISVEVAYENGTQANVSYVNTYTLTPPATPPTSTTPGQLGAMQFAGDDDTDSTDKTKTAAQITKQISDNETSERARATAASINTGTDNDLSLIHI